MRIKYTMTRIYQSGRMETAKHNTNYDELSQSGPLLFIMGNLQRNGFKPERQGDCIIAYGTIHEFMIYIYVDMELEED